jgi:glycosyltransferase involved in cell wall biosynthesis
MSQKVSVIIPTCNDARTLPRTLGSVFAQDLAPDEVIVVNDGGDDPAAFLGPAAARVRLINLEANRGVSAARNIGLAAASGDFVLFLDSDDILSSDFLRLCGEAIAAYPQAAFCIADAIRCPEDRIAEAERALHGGRDGAEARFVDQEELFDHIAANSGFYLPSFTLMNRARLVLSAQGELYETRLVNGEDFQLFLRMALRHGALRIEQPMGIHRLRSGSLSKNETTVWTCRYRSMDMLLAEDPVVSARPRHRRTIQRLRSGGARKVARLLYSSGSRDQAVRILREDLSRHFNLKSALSLLRFQI